MLAIKANKQYRIDTSCKDRYLADGFDIADDEGTIIEKSPKSTVPYKKYIKLKKEFDELNELNIKLKNELDELKKVTDGQTKVTEGQTKKTK